MRTDENDTRIAVQPETTIEQQLLSELFTRLNNLGHEAPAHPEKVGSTLCYYTLDTDEYDVNADLAAEAECGVNEHGTLDPEPGSRVLIIVHNDAGDEASDGAASQDDIDEAVEAVADAAGDDDNEYTQTPEDVAAEIREAEPLADTDYRQLQALAQDASTTGEGDIPANQSEDDLIDELTAFAERVDYFEDTEVDA